MFAVLAPIPDAPGYFAEFSTGQIWSSKSGKVRRLKGGISRGYRIYALQIDGRQVMRSGHRLVATAAYGFCPEGFECRHINGVRDDNRAQNLAWGSPSENNGSDKMAAGKLRFGERHQNSKLTYSAVLEIRRRRKQRTATLAELAARFGVSVVTVSKVARNEAWTK